MTLSDSAMRALIEQGYKLVMPLDENDIQPASIDMHLGDWLRVPHSHILDTFVIDPRYTKPADVFRDVDMRGRLDHCYDLPPGGIALGTTREKIFIPVDLEGVLDGVSSMGRWFCQVHMTAGYFDPGFEGDGVIEIKNNLPWWLRLSCGLRIAQLRLSRIDGQVVRPYGTAGNHYQYQRGPVGSQVAGVDEW